MDPDVRAKPKRTMAMTRPKNQSAFQKAVFMNSPCALVARDGRQWTVAMTPYYMGIWARSRPHVDLDAESPLARQARQVRGDDEVLDRHSLRLQERYLVRRRPT